MLHRSEKFEAKLKLILDKGMQVMWSRGYNGTSVNDIVKAAGVPKGSFYFYFDSKEDFAVKALRHYFNLMYEPASRILKNKKLPAKERLLSFYEYKVKMARNDMTYKQGCLAINLGNEMSEHSEVIRKTIMEFEHTVRSELNAVLKEAQANNEISDELKSEILISFIEDTAKGVLVTMKEMKSPDALDNFIYVLKNVILR